MTHTIGQRLKLERQEQRLTLEKVFEATRIRIQYLQALEADDLSVMPSPVQARGYLRNYAEYLGLDVEQILDEMRMMSAQQSSGEVIGPADEASLPSQPDTKPLDIQPATLAPEPQVEEKPVLIEELPLPLKPKPARRKKTDGSASQPKPTADAPPAASTEAPTRRRGRKKVEPEAVPLLETAPQIVEQPSPLTEPVVQPEWQSPAEGPVVPIEAAAQPEPVLEGVIPSQEDLPQEPDVSDHLWQSWLNRLGSVLSARMKRRTLIPKGSPGLEDDATIAPVELEASPGGETQERPQETSSQILTEIGNELYTRRELLSLHLEEVEHNTHVKARYLEALEKGALDELPSTVQTRGMLSNYATFLDLDVDALLLRFADALQARHRERNPQKPVRKPGQPIIANIPPVRNFIAGDMIFGVGMVILLVGFAIWGVSRVMMIQSQREIKPTAPSISELLLVSPNPSSFTATPTFLAVEAFPGEATQTVEIPTQNANAAVQLNLVAVERTYMRVTVDGEVAFEGRVVPGNAYPFEAENQIEVLIGSGAAIRTVYNGRDLGLMGTFGQIVNNIYLATEIITPTVLPTATPTITSTPTNTAPPTSTLRTTTTPAPSATAAP
ncbi:MAG TPA: RodZ domain-containing protein [Anaerolineales bacterium]|nr:RodZ domain-containing protein [Anaerolineales bacterium]